MNRKILTEKFLSTIISEFEGTIIKDLKGNFEKYVYSENLSESELVLLLLSLSKFLEIKVLNELALNFAQALQINKEVIEEALEMPGINGMLNTYHKFRHFIDLNDKNSSTEYGTVGLRMGILSKQKMSQTSFELIFISISILNSCEKCVLAHENHATQIGVEKTKIHDAVRLAAILKGLQELTKA